MDRNQTAALDATAAPRADDAASHDHDGPDTLLSDPELFSNLNKHEFAFVESCHHPRPKVIGQLSAASDEACPEYHLTHRCTLGNAVSCSP